MRKVAERALANSAVIRNRTVVEMERDMKRAGLTIATLLLLMSFGRNHLRLGQSRPSTVGEIGHCS